MSNMFNDKTGCSCNMQWGVYLWKSNDTQGDNLKCEKSKVNSKELWSDLRAGQESNDQPGWTQIPRKRRSQDLKPFNLLNVPRSVLISSLSHLHLGHSNAFNVIFFFPAVLHYSLQLLIISRNACLAYLYSTVSHCTVTPNWELTCHTTFTSLTHITCVTSLT